MTLNEAKSAAIAYLQKNGTYHQKVYISYAPPADYNFVIEQNAICIYSIDANGKVETITKPPRRK